MKLNIHQFGGRGASSSNKRTTTISFGQIAVGNKFQYKTKDNTTYNFEVTRKNKNDYTVQAMSKIKNGKTQALFGPSNITTLQKDGSKGNGIKLSQTSNWKE